ncbi:MAG TPA: endonuclease/exonuclease/phosphatase family protein [Streptosporangiaceae bacterium]|jgi:endonuclease/exonuclease/phosphatase (EEP) superfamily protein YafD
MSARRVAGTVAAGLAGVAVARLAAADRVPWVRSCTAPLLALTPAAAAAGWASVPIARGRGARTVTALAAAALTATVIPRTLPRRQPEAGGPVLRVLTQNMLIGRAPADALIELARATAADVLFVQELTVEAADRLARAGVGSVFPYQAIGHSDGSAHDTGIYARYPLREDVAAAADGDGRRVGAGGPRAMPQRTARLDLPSGHSVRLVCAHIPPPKPPWAPWCAERWQAELGRVPPPGTPPGDLPVVLAGDFNATVDHAPLRAVLRRGYRDAACEVGNGLVPTWGPEPHGHPPLLTIDHVLVGPGCAVLRTRVHRVPGIDHRALYAELRLPADR